MKDPTSMENKEQLFGKISEYYSGEKHREAIEKELERSPESRELFRWIDVFWNKFNPRPGRSGIIQYRTHKKIEESREFKPFSRLRVVKYAAMILLALSISGIIYYYFPENVNMTEVMSGTGEVKEVKLPDGSKVWLNAQSSLRYPEAFKGDLREVTMTGEVYFEVKHNPECPFIVSSGPVQVKVLGTSFLVSNYANEPVIDTYLAEGRIELGLKELKKTMELIPGDEVTFNKLTSAIAKVNSPYSVLDSWRFGKLTFYNETLFEIARKLERKFGKEIRISNETVGNMKYTADFESENLEQILEFLDKVSEVTYEPIENGYMITKNRN
jgi:ferric-dicitrate binding protein FerR (iron transport regulator)